MHMKAEALLQMYVSFCVTQLLLLIPSKKNYYFLACFYAVILNFTPIYFENFIL